MLEDLVAYTNALLNVAEIEDYANAFNGLQVGNSGRVRRIAAAVDACEHSICAAGRAGADLLVVHHGMLWGGAQPVTGALYRKLKHAIEHDLAIYSAHLPLDAHPELGNNALLCRKLGLDAIEPFLGVGFKGRCAATLDEVVRRTESAVGGPVRVARGGEAETAVIGVATGGAGGEVAKAAAEGVDTFITGEGPHWSYLAAEELGINLVYAGHYATETFGVAALAAHLAARYSLSWEFIDHPTGL